MTVRSLVLKSIVAALAIVPAVTCRSAEQAKSEKAEDSMRGEKAGQVRDDNGLKMKLVWCPPGFVTMEQFERTEAPVEEGADADDDDPKSAAGDKPRIVEKITPVKVFLTRGYWLGKYEVTQSDWKQVMETEPWKNQEFAKEGDDFPATFVSWDDAMEFCRKLTEREWNGSRLPAGWEYTLPTEAQWERGCRARTETKFSFGDDDSKLDEYAWFLGNAARAGENYAHRVGQKKPNPWGMHDMHGNVFEWCRDYDSDNNDKLPGGRDPEKTKKGEYHVIRGGHWLGVAKFCQSADRRQYDPSIRKACLGLRVAISSVR